MLKLVVFDWNGTCLSDKEFVFGAVKHIFNCYGIPAPHSQTWFDEVAANFIDAYHKNGLPKSVTAEDLSIIWKNYFACRFNGNLLRPGVKEVLKFLKTRNIKTAILSGEADSILQKRIGEMNLRPLLNIVRGDCYDKKDGLEKIIGMLRVDPKNVTYIDDNFDGLIGAKSLGIHTIGFTNGWQSLNRIAAAGPSRLAESFANILAVLQQQTQ